MKTILLIVVIFLCLVIVLPALLNLGGINVFPSKDGSAAKIGKVMIRSANRGREWAAPTFSGSGVPSAIFDITSVVFDRNDKNHYYAAAWWNGVVELVNDVEAPLIVKAPVTFIVPAFVIVPNDMDTSPAESVTVPPLLFVNVDAIDPCICNPMEVFDKVSVPPLLFVKVAPKPFSSNVKSLNVTVPVLLNVGEDVFPHMVMLLEAMLTVPLLSTVPQPISFKV